MTGPRRGTGVAVGDVADARAADAASASGGWTISTLLAEGPALALCQREALGTTARLVVWPQGHEVPACAAVDRVLEDLDRQVSRFRDDSELRQAEARAGTPTILTPGAADALTVALAAAVVSGDRVDPTVGGTLCELGYEGDFGSIDPLRDRGPEARPAPGWRAVRLSGRVLRLAPGIRLDLGATAKGLGSDRAAAAALAAVGGRGGVLVSLGGDLAVSGTPPARGWPIGVSEDPAVAVDAVPVVVRLRGGGMATSSVLHRRWHGKSGSVHHIVDPSTGTPVDGVWRTATVAARNCVEANTASTTALVAGENAEAWLAAHGLAARLVDHHGGVRLVGGWPRHPDSPVPVPRRSIFDRRSAEVTR